MDTLGKRFHVNFVGYAHWFMTMRISYMKDHSISMDQDRYATSIAAKYLDNAKVKASTKCYNTTLPSDVIFTKADVSIIDEQVRSLIGNSIFNIEIVLVH